MSSIPQTNHRHELNPTVTQTNHRHELNPTAINDYLHFLPQHLYASENRDEIIRSAIEHAGNYIGITLRLRKDPLTFEGFVGERLGKYGSDECITSLAEFVVQKISPRHMVRDRDRERPQSGSALLCSRLSRL